MSCCSFSVCSLLTDVRDSVTEMPRDPDEVKSLLFEHLGFGNKPESLGVGKVGSGGGDTCLSSFKHPISYTDPEKLHELAPSIIEDLELLHVKPKMTVGGGLSKSEHVEGVPTVDAVDAVDADDAVNGLYHYVFSPKSVYGTEHLPIWSKYYTTDIEYLKHTQTLLEMFDNELLERCIAQNTESASSVEAFSTMKKTWTEFRGTGKIHDFKEKFSYVETPFLSKLNTSSSFLQFLSLYNISSPVIALLTPIIVLIIPFFVLLMRGIGVSLSEYIDILKQIISQHSIGKFLTQFDTVSIEQKMYIMMSVVFYFIQIYQNIMACVRFYNNIKLVHTHIHTINGYLTATGVNMNYMIQLIQTYHLSTYEPFREELSERYRLLEEVTRALTDIAPFSLSINKFFQIGYVMKNYYSLFSQTDLNELLDYSFGFNAYMEHLTACRTFVIDGMIKKCSFVVAMKEAEAGAGIDAVIDAVIDVTRPLTPVTEEAEADATDAATDPSVEVPPAPPAPPTVRKGITKLSAQFYAPLKAQDVAKMVANDITLDKQLIITGPNAAGKTTVIKSTLFNLIISQQIGYGFYENAEINPYDYLHCYLNIPDTSGRDSLFQAESRRCMEILRCIMDNPAKRHFCIFDELYSGTNPYEAVAAAYGYIDYISKNPKVDLILTTHYIELCQLLEKQNNGVIRNLHMSVSSQTGEYLYKIADGISTIKGGLKVLRDLDYPTEIVECARLIIEQK
jgi:energy-coupling factor transporter ATP-binding protein EcfA2